MTVHVGSGFPHRSWRADFYSPLWFSVYGAANTPHHWPVALKTGRQNVASRGQSP
ncbi:Uncharacterised protein [Vibrio cholerae]|nr:Uncharacterised protein [Vibrio cholerae]